jgi:hypothetical protein
VGRKPRDDFLPKMILTPFSAIKSEFKGRLPFYWNDWYDGFHSKVVSAIVFVYFINIIPAITFGAYLQRTTENNYGVIEVLLSTSVCGMIYSVFAGQPLIIVGVTGPVSIFSTTLYSICQSLNIPYLGFMFWVAIWATIMHLVLATFNLCSLVTLITRFTCEIFGSLIGCIFVYEGVHEIVKQFEGGTNVVGSGIFSLLLALITFGLARTLGSAASWTVVPKALGGIVADYAMPFAVFTVSTIPFLAIFDSLKIELLQVPSEFGTSSNRTWIVDPLSVSTGMIFGAIAPAFLITVLIFFDHNVSSLMSQLPTMNLKKPTAFNYDFVIVGISMLLTGTLGLPFTHGLIPQAPLHVLALAKIKHHHEIVDGVTLSSSHITGVVENRVSNFIMSLLVGLTALIPQLLQIVGYIPNAVLAGLFLFMGFGSFSNNQFVSRLALFVCDNNYRRLYFEHDSEVIQNHTYAFTILQIISLVTIFGVTFTKAAISFPILIAILVPIRIFLISKFLTKSELEYLDGDGVAQEEEGGELILAREVHAVVITELDEKTHPNDSLTEELELNSSTDKEYEKESRTIVQVGEL